MELTHDHERQTFTQLIEETIRTGHGKLHPSGALLVDTGKWTGRAVESRRIVNRPEAYDLIAWGKVNKPIDREQAETVRGALTRRFKNEKTYTMKGYVGPYPIEVTSTSPWHIAFARTLFRSTPINASTSELKALESEKPIRIFHEPYLTTSELDVKCDVETLIALDVVDREVLIVGTAYAGEIKKSGFSMANFLLPARGLLPMHASANTKLDGTDSCILFGLSGTGKTTLSADPERSLIGDDEILWSESGISNLEGGCYAKLINLSEKREPDIYHAIHRFGAILENVSFDESTRGIDFDDGSRTENTRGAYPLEHIANLFPQSKQAGVPKTIVFLTADAFGALPAVARLDEMQAQYHFISGYTAKVAGTELGVKEPTATFSACFGAPFMPRPASVYARLLAKKAQASGAQFWLLNTGWTGGGYGKGARFPIDVTRSLLHAIQNGVVANAPMEKHPIFGFEVPKNIPGVDPKWLAIPEGDSVRMLAEKFEANAQSFAHEWDAKVRSQGGPRLS